MLSSCKATDHPNRKNATAAVASVSVVTQYSVTLSQCHTLHRHLGKVLPQQRPAAAEQQFGTTATTKQPRFAWIAKDYVHEMVDLVQSIPDI